MPVVDALAAQHVQEGGLVRFRLRGGPGVRGVAEVAVEVALALHKPGGVAGLPSRLRLSRAVCCRAT